MQCEFKEETTFFSITKYYTITIPLLPMMKGKRSTLEFHQY